MGHAPGDDRDGEVDGVAGQPRWLILLGVFGLFALGVYLVELRNLRRTRKVTPRH
ncbi:hypothetical protein [Aeromicrobium ginsengisoli]|uniref:hypothetical protein n=1 Tax=Aeromicrobium ginsengisoli TaxID=363867 RepID=UPI00165EF8A6|nr:hypothetical protein [Aeromicrobium ginsengisoli]